MIQHLFAAHHAEKRSKIAAEATDGPGFERRVVQVRSNHHVPVPEQFLRRNKPFHAIPECHSHTQLEVVHMNAAVHGFPVACKGTDHARVAAKRSAQVPVCLQRAPS